MSKHPGETKVSPGCSIYRYRATHTMALNTEPSIILSLNKNVSFYE